MGCEFDGPGSSRGGRALAALPFGSDHVATWYAAFRKVICKAASIWCATTPLRAQSDFEAGPTGAGKNRGRQPARLDTPRTTRTALPHSWEGKKTLSRGPARGRVAAHRADVIEGAIAQAFQALIFARTGETDKPSLKLSVCSQLLLLSTTPMTASPLSDLRTRWNGTRFETIRAFKKSRHPGAEDQFADSDLMGCGYGTELRGRSNT